MFLNRFRKSLFLLVSVVVVSLSGSPAALANSSRITRGDVEAVFNAFLTGGRTILFRGQAKVVEGAPADFVGSQGAIRPFGGTPFDGKHYCVDDWHVILIAQFDGGDKSYTRKDAIAYVSQVVVSFTLDGVPLAGDRTPIKRFLAPQGFGLDEAYGFQAGRIMSPDELSVGAHALGVTVHDPVYGDYADGIQFFVDPSNSVTCSQ
jgi:hypothetical protein